MTRWIVAMLCFALPAWAQPLLDVGQLPPPAQSFYADFLLSNLPRAFAMDAAGHAGWYSGQNDDPAKVQDGALKLCADHGGMDCRLYAIDLSVVWPGKVWMPPQGPGPLVDTWNYGFFPDKRFLWHGPAQAVGVAVWVHGGGGTMDQRGAEPAALLRPFNNAGYDVIRYDRAPGVDNPVRAAGWLRDELPKLRASGYRRVVVAGESRGAWTALQILDTAGLADVVIALVPAAQGSGDSPRMSGGGGAIVPANLSSQIDDLRQMMAQAEPAHSRVAMVQFEHDPFASDLNDRAALVSGLRTKEDAVLLVDRPAGFTGHEAWWGYAFAKKYGACLFHFATDATPPARCAP